MARIRKEHAGSDSFGHVWPEDGATVEIDDPEQIASLVAIPDGGFSEVTPEAKKSRRDQQEELSEIDPGAPDGEPGDNKPAPRKTAAKRPGRKPASADVQE